MTELGTKLKEALGDNSTTGLENGGKPKELNNQSGSSGLTPCKNFRVEGDRKRGMRTTVEHIRAQAKEPYRLNISDISDKLPTAYHVVPLGLTVLTGGPADGKTTLLKRMFECCELQELPRFGDYELQDIADVERGKSKVWITAYESDYDDNYNSDEIAELLKKDDETIGISRFPYITAKSCWKALETALKDPRVGLIAFDGLRFLNTEARGSGAIMQSVPRGVFDLLTSISTFVRAHNKTVIATLGTDSDDNRVNDLYFTRSMASVPMVIKPTTLDDGIYVAVTRRDIHDRTPIFFKLPKTETMVKQRPLAIPDFLTRIHTKAVDGGSEGLYGESGKAGTLNEIELRETIYQNRPELFGQDNVRD